MLLVVQMAPCPTLAYSRGFGAVWSIKLSCVLCLVMSMVYCAVSEMDEILGSIPSKTC